MAKKLVFAFRLCTAIGQLSWGDYGWSRDSVASQGNEVVVDGWVLYTQR